MKDYMWKIMAALGWIGFAFVFALLLLTIYMAQYAGLRQYTITSTANETNLSATSRIYADSITVYTDRVEYSMGGELISRPLTGKTINIR